MSDRDRLIKLLLKEQEASIEYAQQKIKAILNNAIVDCLKTPFEFSADYLLANGVVLPPVEVGQTVWYIKGGYYRKTGLEATPIKVTEINKKWHSKILCWGFIANGTRYRFSSIGKTVFLTKEEAEEKLKELGK